MYKLYYDVSCPVCTNFANMIKKKVDLSKIQFLPIGADENNFKLELPDGKILLGQDAVDELSKSFPSVLNYFWMLPQKFRKPALNIAYKAGSVIRQVIKKTTGCGCKNKRR